MQQILLKLARALPRLRTPIQLSGLIVLAIAGYIVAALRTQPQVAVPLGVLGVEFLVFGQVFVWLGPPPARTVGGGLPASARLLLWLFLIFSVTAIMLVSIAGYFLTSARTPESKNKIRWEQNWQEWQDGPSFVSGSSTPTTTNREGLLRMLNGLELDSGSGLDMKRNELVNSINETPKCEKEGEYYNLEFTEALRTQYRQLKTAIRNEAIANGVNVSAISLAPGIEAKVSSIESHLTKIEKMLTLKPVLSSRPEKPTEIPNSDALASIKELAQEVRELKMHVDLGQITPQQRKVLDSATAASKFPTITVEVPQDWRLYYMTALEYELATSRGQQIDKSLWKVLPPGGGKLPTGKYFMVVRDGNATDHTLGWINLTTDARLRLHDLNPWQTSSPPPIVVRKLEVHRLSKIGKLDQPRGLLGVKSFSARPNDGVTVHGKLSEPAYCYLIAYRPDGTEEICYPEDPSTPPGRTDQPRYPYAKPEETYGLEEGEGLMVFALVVSRRPLPAYNEWRTQRSDSPWRKTTAQADVVWCYDGRELLAATPDDPAGTRSKGRKLGSVGPLGELIIWMQRAPDVETVAAVAFPVVPDPVR